jgi:hypothetical protein
VGGSLAFWELDVKTLKTLKTRGLSSAIYEKQNIVRNSEPVLRFFSHMQLEGSSKLSVLSVAS